MEGIQVTLEEVLRCREMRAARQTALIRRYQTPVISFCMNIPGPVKSSQAIRKSFDRGKERILDALKAEKLETLECTELHEATGDELLLAVKAPARRLKELTCRIEEESPAGRLYDMDVIGADGVKLSRSGYRKCLICGRQAQECARARRHTVEELQAKTEELLNG